VQFTRLPFSKKLAPDLEVKSILPEPLVVAVPTAHRFAGGKLKIEELSEEPFILLQRMALPPSMTRFLAFAKRAASPPR
jgi:DNA-binding transcriptional LysR family regulator